jgi:biotin carboxyl carrier protein
MKDDDGSNALLASVVAHFERSNFQYLALDHGSLHIRLARESMDNVRHELRAAGTSVPSKREPAVTEVTAPSVGVVESAVRTGALPRAGETVEQGDVLLIVRKFRNSTEVRSPLRGVIESVRVTRAEFVEFGQLLLTVGERR